MPTDFAFRLSTYLTLGLSCLCLGYSEWDLLPEVSLFTAAVVLLLGVSFWCEGRYALTIPQANRLGLVIGVLAALWVGWQFVRPSGGLLYTLPWPASLLPYLGPLLMVLMPAKLFRPKHVGDWWAMQGIGLVGVGLATAMATGMSEVAGFVLLFAAYCLAGVWSLALFFYRRGAGAVAPIPGTEPAPAPVVVADSGPPPSAGRHLRRAVGWAAVSAAVALPLFFLTPRSPGPRWHFSGNTLETGFAADQMIDLNRTGELKANREVAFEVVARRADGQAFDDLPAGQRWRGVAFRGYDGGKWSQAGGGGGALFALRGIAGSGTGVPDLGPGQLRLEFRPTPRLPRPVLADPVAWEAGGPSPVGPRDATAPWPQLLDGSFAFTTDKDGRLRPYVQYFRPPTEPGLGPPFELATPDPAHPAFRQLTSLTRGYPALRKWAVDTFDRLVREGKIPAAAGERARGRGLSLVEVAPEDYEAVGRAFRDHLSAGVRADGGAEFEYDLKLRRVDKSLDPIEDFLLNTRAGHCERFASALALSLRAVGVPTTFVLGFRGCEPLGAGRYAVRQETAHAWVEVLVPRPGPPGWPPVVWHWLTLDPTPGTDEPADGPAAPTDWLGAATQSGAAFFSDFIVGYNPDRQRQVVEAVSAHLAENAGSYAFGLVALAAFGVGLAVWRRRRAGADGPGSATHAVGLPWYDELVAALTAAGLPPTAGQTPREHALAAAAALRANAKTSAVADVPPAVAAALYRLRYAGQTLPADQTAELSAAVRRLAEVVGGR